MNYVKRLAVEWFRGIRKGVVEDFGQVNVFVGRNGVGKSTLLEALYLVSAVQNDFDAIRRVNKLDYLVRRRAGRSEGWNSSRQVLWYSMDSKRNIKISFSLGTTTYDFEVFNDMKERKPVKLRRGKVLDNKLRELLSGILFIENRLFLDYVSNIETYSWPILAAKRLDKIVLKMVKEEFEPDAEGFTYIPLGEL